MIPIILGTLLITIQLGVLLPPEFLGFIERLLNGLGLMAFVAIGPMLIYIGLKESKSRRQ